MIDQQVIMPGLTIHHAHFLIPELLQFSDKPPVITDRQGNRNGQIGSAEKEFVLHPGGSRQSREDVHVPVAQGRFGIGAVGHHFATEANIQLFFQAGNQIRYEAGGLTILSKLEWRPVWPEGHSQIGVLFEEFTFSQRQGNGGWILCWQLCL